MFRPLLLHALPLWLALVVPLKAQSEDPPFVLPTPRASSGVRSADTEAALAKRLCEAIDQVDCTAAAAALAAGANPNVGMGAGEDETKDRTPLIHAVLADSAPLIDLLVAHGARLEAGDSSNHTPLMYAALAKRLEMARHLIRIGARLDPEDAKGVRAGTYVEEAPELTELFETSWDANASFLAALQAGDLDAANGAIGDGASPNANDGTLSLLMGAVRKGDLALVETCIAAGCRVDLFLVAGFASDTPLGVAAQIGSLEMLRAMLAKGAPGRAALDDALANAAGCEHGDRKERVQALLTAGGNPAVQMLLKTPALPGAAARGDLETMALLLANGADQELADQALVRAAGIEDGAKAMAVVRALLACGADPSFSYLYTTALGVAAAQGRLEVAALLIDRVDDETLNMAVAEAARGANAAGLKWLCERGGKRIDFAVEFGLYDPPLIAAISGDCVDCVAVLLGAGADVNLPPSLSHDTPLITAVRQRNLAAIGQLLAAGAEPARRWSPPLREPESALSVAEELADEAVLALVRAGVAPAFAHARDPLGAKLDAANLQFEAVDDFYVIRFHEAASGRSQIVCLGRTVETFESLSVQEIFSLSYDRPEAPSAEVLTTVFRKRYRLGGFVLEEPSEEQPNWRIRFRVAAATAITKQQLDAYLNVVRSTADAMEKELDSEDRL
jgi:ankyrin repeat protein